MVNEGNSHWGKWSLGELAIGKMVIGGSCQWEKWPLREMVIGEMGIWEMVHRENDMVLVMPFREG